ncbi:MAG: divergent polysaccharide deacetylase family protein [Pseudomonadota bacterium]
MRGSIQGSLWALVLGGTGLGLASVIADRPTVGAGGEVAVSAASENQSAPSVETATIAMFDPPGAVNAPDIQIAIDRLDVPQPDLAVPSQPLTPQAVEILTAPAMPRTFAAAGPRDLLADAPAPMPDTQATVGTDPSVAATDADDTFVASAPQAPAIGAQDDTLDPASVQTAQTPTDRPLVENTATEFSPLIVNEDPALQNTPSTDETETTEAVVAQVPEVPAPDTADIATDPAVATQVDDAQAEVAADADTDEIADPVTDTEAAQASETPRVGGPVPVNRPGATPSATAGQDAEVVSDEPVEDVLPALARFAAAFENTGDVPLIAIMLIDDADQPVLSTALGPTELRPTIVIDALSDEANARMVAYRDAGAEVAMQVRLPDGAQPTDVEVAFEAAFDILPEAALLYSDGTGVLQSSRSVTEQVMDVLAADGRGFVSIVRGLNNTVRTAEQADVPAVAVLRNLDDDATSTAALTRALDQAAFRARQGTPAVLVGTLSPATIATIESWLAELDPDLLQPAPVSALLLGPTEPDGSDDS